MREREREYGYKWIWIAKFYPNPNPNGADFKMSLLEPQEKGERFRTKDKGEQVELGKKIAFERKSPSLKCIFRF